MKTKRVATQNVMISDDGSLFSVNWGSILLMGMLLLVISCAKNDDLETIDDDLETIDNEPPISNVPPIAKAGADQTITLPSNSVILDGSGSTDPENNITTYRWTKISGPTSYSFTNADAVQTQVADLVEGDYKFELKVTDAGGLIDKDTTQVKVSKNPDTSSVDIYVAGQLNSLPVYWKNGQVVYLSNGAYNERSSSIVVDNNDVYVSGLEDWDLNIVPRYWKNDQEIRLSDTPGVIGITSIAVANGDVYVAGWDGYYIASYWKNEQKVALPCNSSYAWANSITVVGNDVYVAGYDGGMAKYWKNGQPVALNDGSNQAHANSIVVVGDDIYVAGSEWNGSHSVAKYWKNGQEVSLKGGTKHAYANSIVVVGNDVYVAGWEGDSPGLVGGTGSVIKYWKNGQEVALTNGTTYAWGGYIAVVGSDIYVAGTESGSAKYWVNGQAFKLSDSARATSIVVVNRE